MKVSIIVAIYKVSQYLKQCLDSIVNQTYQNIEIICVVGNTDVPSMNITEEYAKNDSRIKFVPVKPEGVAAARNAGLREVTGDAIAFVDGDDYVEIDMIETMVSAMNNTSADISIVSKYYLYENTVEGIFREGQIVYDKKGVFKEILQNENFFLHLWDKLYKRELFTGISFKEGEIVEDRQICFELLNKADKFVFTPKSKYYFRQCLDSSSKVYKNVTDSLREDYIICDKIKKEYPSLKKDISLFLMKENMSVIQSGFLYEVFSKEHDKEYLDYVRKHMIGIMLNGNVSNSFRAKVVLCAFFTEKFRSITVKRRKAFLDSHKHFRSGNDWEKLFKEQGLNV